MSKGLKRIVAISLSVIIGVFAILGALELCVIYAEKSYDQWYAYGRYEKEDITQTLLKPDKTDADYEFLYAQTGLTKLGVDGLLEKGERSRIYQIQDFYFKNHEVVCEPFFPYTYIETLKSGRGTFCALEEGDIIVSATTHSFFLRVGHATIVVDGAREVLGESLGPGSPSDTVGAWTIADLADFMVLRPTGIPTEVRGEVANYVEKELMGIDYDFTVGILSKKFPDEIKKTQCAHFCWYGYKKFGYDIDANGGLTVKPQDIANSPYFEVVQIFGFNPETLWRY